MTREENTAKLAQLRSETEALVKDYNDAIQNGKYEDATKADNAMTEKINEYTATVRDMCFEDCKNTDNPMLTAVTTLSFVTIGVKDEQNNGDMLEMRADEYVKSLYGNVDMKGASDEIKKVRADFIAAQTMEIVDPINITTELTALEKEINDFVVEIDSALSVSNALTELEIAY